MMLQLGIEHVRKGIKAYMFSMFVENIVSTICRICKGAGVVLGGGMVLVVVV